MSGENLGGAEMQDINEAMRPPQEQMDISREYLTPVVDKWLMTSKFALGPFDGEGKLVEDFKGKDLPLLSKAMLICDRMFMEAYEEWGEMGRNGLINTSKIEGFLGDFAKATELMLDHTKSGDRSLFMDYEETQPIKKGTRKVYGQDTEYNIYSETNEGLLGKVSSTVSDRFKAESDAIASFSKLMRSVVFIYNKSGDLESLQEIFKLNDRMAEAYGLRAFDYKRIFEAKGILLPTEEIGTKEERIEAIKKNVVPYFFKEGGKSDNEIAAEIEDKRKGVMTSLALRWLVMDAMQGKDSKYYKNSSKSLLMSELRDNVAVVLGKAFGYKEEALKNKSSGAFIDAAGAVTRAMYLFYQLGLNTEYGCIYKNESGDKLAAFGGGGDLLDGSDRAIFVHMIAKFRGKLKDWTKMGIGRYLAYDNATVNELPVAAHCMTCSREYKSKGKRDHDVLSVMQMLAGVKTRVEVGGKKQNRWLGLRMDQIPWGDVVESGDGEDRLKKYEAVRQFFDASYGKKGKSFVKIEGMSDDDFYLKYIKSMYFSYRFVGWMYDQPQGKIVEKYMKDSGEFNALNKFSEGSLKMQRAEFGKLTDEEFKNLMEKVNTWKKLNFIIALTLAQTERSRKNENTYNGSMAFTPRLDSNIIMEIENLVFNNARFFQGKDLERRVFEMFNRGVYGGKTFSLEDAVNSPGKNDKIFSEKEAELLAKSRMFRLARGYSSYGETPILN